MSDTEQQLRDQLTKVEAAIAAQENLRETMPAEQVEAVLRPLREKRQALLARLEGSGAIAQGDDATAAGERGVAVSGDVSGTIVTGDSNTVQQGGIRANKIDADNVVEGVQMQGGDATQAQGLIALADKLQRGGITADEIQAGSVVSGVQYIADPQNASTDDLRRELAALREQVQAAIEAGDIADEADAEDARDALATAEQELENDEPSGNRVTRKLKEVTEILTESARTAEAAGKVGSTVIKLAPYAASVLAIARSMFGG